MWADYWFSSLSTHEPLIGPNQGTCRFYDAWHGLMDILILAGIVTSHSQNIWTQAVKFSLGLWGYHFIVRVMAAWLWSRKRSDNNLVNYEESRTWGSDHDRKMLYIRLSWWQTVKVSGFSVGTGALLLLLSPNGKNPASKNKIFTNSKHCHNKRFILLKFYILASTKWAIYDFFYNVWVSKIAICYFIGDTLFC